MSLLDNELMWKYFGCTRKGCEENGRQEMAENIISAMQQPIRVGERYLEMSQPIEERICGNPFSDDSDIGRFHPYQLRLPDKFQKKECDHRELKCISCNLELPVDKPQSMTWKSGCVNKFDHLAGLCSKDPLRDKIDEIAREVARHGKDDIDGKLRELFELARR